MKCVVRKTHDDALRYGGYCARWYTSMSEWVNRTCGFSPPSFAFDHHLTYRRIHSPTRWTLEKCLFKERGEFDPFSGNNYCRILSPLWWRFVTVNFFVCKKRGKCVFVNAEGVRHFFTCYEMSAGICCSWLTLFLLVHTSRLQHSYQNIYRLYDVSQL